MTKITNRTRQQLRCVYLINFTIQKSSSSFSVIMCQDLVTTLTPIDACFCAGLHAAELKRMRAHIFFVRTSYIFTVMLGFVYLETEYNYILVECSIYERKREGKRGRGRGRVMAVDLLSKLHSKLVKVSQYHSQSEVDCPHGLCPQVLSVLTGVDQ